MGDEIISSREETKSRTQDPTPIFPVANATESYWRTEKHWVDEFRSTESLPTECDVVIIGAGMSGVSTAYHLVKGQNQETTPSILILEARQVCSGATGRNGGHVKEQVATIAKYIESYDYETAVQLLEFSLQHITALKDIVECEKLDCEFELRRSFDVWLHDAGAKNILDFWNSCRAKGHEWMKNYCVIDGRHVEQITSMKEAKLAFSTPACSFWPYKLVTQLLGQLVDQQAVNLQTNTPVGKIGLDAETKMNMVYTSRGIIRAHKVIFATNGYTAGLVDEYSHRIVPYRGTATHIKPAKPVSPHLSNTYNINYPPGARRDYMNPRPDGGIVVGGAKWTYDHKPSNCYNNWDDSTLIEGAQAHFDGLMQRHFHGWENSNARSSQTWTGIMGLTADGLPHVGEVPGTDGRQYILAGFNGGGMPLILLCGRHVAEMVRHGIAFEDTSLPKLFKTTRERLRDPVELPKSH